MPKEKTLPPKTTAKKSASVKIKKEETPKKKKTVKSIVIPEESRETEESEGSKPSRYYEAVGRRKTSVARVRLFTRGDKEVVVNDRKLEEYFAVPHQQGTVMSPLRKMKSEEKFRVLVKVSGGGTTGQAEAIRHGISRALTIFNPDFRKRLRKAGYLTRDPRKVERKKPGLRKARRAPQWQKR